MDKIRGGRMKILVGLSGGVDSAVAAYVLQAQGHEVECAFMRNWDSLTNNDLLGNPTLEDEVCAQELDYEDARKVAEKLGLTLHRVDFVKEYWDDVFVTFLEEYRRGRTPNPDILCNQHIKFAAFYDFARKMGFDWLATGHYARIEHAPDHSELLRAVDTNKDQTYFLCQMPTESLKHTLFPIGEMKKEEVRAIAMQLGLDVATKKDSTGICFIGERNFREFLKNYLPSKKGKIIDIETKTILGSHQGVLYYTIGQRKGLGIGGNLGPWFVIGKDIVKNELYVARLEDNPWLFSEACTVSHLNWFNPMNLDEEMQVSAKFRYRQDDQAVRIKLNAEGMLHVTFDLPVSSVTPGQEAVFYLGDVCLGGGVIEDVYKDGMMLDARISESFHA
jgi:tRNA-specific 2-thiouridylase